MDYTMSKLITGHKIIKYHMDSKGKLFLIYLSSLCFIYIIPIIIANRYYIDDLGRAQDGYFGWSSNGRPLADLLMSLVNLNAESTIDISPLTLFIGIIIFIICAYLYFRSNLNHFNSIASAVICFLIIANPFLLENLSYKFDVVPMIAALSLMLLPFLSYSSKLLKWFFSVSFVVISLCLYQAVIGFFVCLAVIEFIINASNKQYTKQLDLIIDILCRAAQLLVGYFIYSNISAHFVFGEYNIEHSTLISIDREGINIFINNALAFLSMVLLYVNGMLLLSLISLATVSIFIIKTAIGIFNNNRRSFLNLIIIILLLISPLIIMAFAAIHLCLLKYPVFSDRVMASFSGFMLLVGISYFSLIKNFKHHIILSTPFVLPLLVYSYAFGSAMDAQNKFDYFLSHIMAEEISRNDPEATKTIMFFGVQPSSPHRDNAIRRFPSLSSVVPLYYNNGWWGKGMIKMFGIQNPIENANYTINPCEMKMVSKGQMYNTFVNDKYFVIDFRKISCK